LYDWNPDDMSYRYGEERGEELRKYSGATVLDLVMDRLYQRLIDDPVTYLDDELEAIAQHEFDALDEDASLLFDPRDLERDRIVVWGATAGEKTGYLAHVVLEAETDIGVFRDAQVYTGVVEQETGLDELIG
jgi:hypothetical protein